MIHPQSSLRCCIFTLVLLFTFISHFKCEKTKPSLSVTLDIPKEEASRLVNADSSTSEQFFDFLHDGRALSLFNQKSSFTKTCSLGQSEHSGQMLLNLEEEGGAKCGLIDDEIHVCCNGFFCKFPNMTCGQDAAGNNFVVLGTCTPIPTSCPPCSEEEQMKCGCDGNEYCSVCEMNKIRVSEADESRCKDVFARDDALAVFHVGGNPFATLFYTSFFLFFIYLTYELI